MTIYAVCFQREFPHFIFINRKDFHINMNKLNLVEEIKYHQRSGLPQTILTPPEVGEQHQGGFLIYNISCLQHDAILYSLHRQFLSPFEHRELHFLHDEFKELKLATHYGHM